MGGTNVIVMEVDGLGAQALLDLSDRFKQRSAPAAVVLGSREDGTANLVVNFDEAVAARLSAGDVVKEIAPIVGGGGGGRPTMARAGGKEPEQPPDALARARELIAAALAVKVLALDYGSARTGVAVSDPTGTVARPLGVVERVGEPDGFERLVEVIAHRGAGEIVVGLPLTLRGEHGEQARETAEFVEALRAAVEVPVETYDERFTSVLAGGDDARAAAHLLSSYLEWRSTAR